MDLLLKSIRTGPYNSRSFNRQISHRYLFGLSDSQTIESSAYQQYQGEKPIALAIDISSMVGCPMNCKFCESATIPYIRPLTVDEIVSQVIYMIKQHDFPNCPKIVCSFQGIGEPSLMPEIILKAIRQLVKLDNRIVINISTLGERLESISSWNESDIPIEKLQISISGTTPDQINWLMPRSTNIYELIKKVMLCINTGRIQMVKFNYILIKNYNDSDKDVQGLIELFKGTPAIVKISALNQTLAAQKFGLKQSGIDRAKEISSELLSQGINSYIFGSFDNTNMSCGQFTFVGQGGSK